MVPEEAAAQGGLPGDGHRQAVKITHTGRLGKARRVHRATPAPRLGPRGSSPSQSAGPAGRGGGGGAEWTRRRREFNTRFPLISSALPLTVGFFVTWRRAREGENAPSRLWPGLPRRGPSPRCDTVRGERRLGVRALGPTPALLLCEWGRGPAPTRGQPGQARPRSFRTEHPPGWPSLGSGWVPAGDPRQTQPERERVVGAHEAGGPAGPSSSGRERPGNVARPGGTGPGRQGPGSAGRNTGPGSPEGRGGRARPGSAPDARECRAVQNAEPCSGSSVSRQSCFYVS